MHGSLDRRQFLELAAAGSAALSIWPYGSSSTHRTPGDHSFREKFARPGREFGPVPLWWWDGDPLEKDRITAQLETLEERGVPAVCFMQMHQYGPPEGPQVEYFSEAWWEYMIYAAEECRRLDMDLWVHDLTYHARPPLEGIWEYRILNDIPDHPEFQGHVLDRVSKEVTGPDRVRLEWPEAFTPVRLAAYPRRSDGSIDLDEAVELDAQANGRSLAWEVPSGAWHVAAIGHRPKGLRRTSRQVVDAFIDRHYEEYVRRLGDMVGEVLVGTFEDELITLDGHVPYDRNVIAAFGDRYGYDPTASLAALYEEAGPQTEKIRSQYYDVVVELLEANWFRPLYRWHEEHDMMVSHDNWGRNDIADQTTQYGDYFRTMRWYQAPGYDDGGRIESIGTRNCFDAKLAQSIADCYDRPRVWGELFHSTGWGVSPELLMAGIAENFCYGNNLYDKHGCYYSTLGGWYWHAPPDPHFRQPYWAHMDGFNAAVTRLSYLFSQGEPVVDVALLYPASSMHADWTPEEGIGETGRRISSRTRDLCIDLYRSGTDLIFVDDESLAGAGVENGTLRISEIEVPVLMLGPGLSLRRATLEKAVAHFDAGGVVVAAGQLPVATAEGGRNDPELAAALEHLFGPRYAEAQTDSSSELGVDQEIVHEGAAGGLGLITTRGGSELTPVLDRHVEPDIRTSETGIYHVHRRTEEHDVYLFLNTREEARSVSVSLRSVGRPEEWDPESGSTEQIYAYRIEENRLAVGLDFAPHQFRCLVVRRDVDPSPRVPRSSFESITDVSDAGSGYEISGFLSASGTPSATVTDASGSRQAGGEPVAVPEESRLDTSWTFEAKPVLDNRWGDFRYPASEEKMGIEVRRFRYRPEAEDEDGLDLGWQREALPAGDEREEWEEVQWSYGPQFWMHPNVEPGEQPDPPTASAHAGWEPYVFSKAIGKPGTHPEHFGFEAIVSDDFLKSPDGDGLTYFWTSVRAPSARTVIAHFGPGIEQIWVDGEHLLYGHRHSYDGTIEFLLNQGTSPVLLAVEPDTETYFALKEPGSDPRDLDMTWTPRVRWFYESDPFAFDFTPWRSDPVGWYRFELPVGTRSFTLPVRGNARVWVNGEERAVRGGEVQLAAAVSEPAAAAVRLDQEPGAYGGAAWEKPTGIRGEPVEIELAPWSELGIRSYSGLAEYQTTFSLPGGVSDARVLLDLGDVAVSASVTVNGQKVDTAYKRPYRYEISESVRPGENTLTVEVANTVANHYATETPTDYVYEGQKRSGLIGPVTLSVQPRASVRTS